MSRWRQPWAVHELAGRRIKLQVLDPETAFEIEPEIIRHLGETLALALADPIGVMRAIGSHAFGTDEPAIAASRSIIAAAQRIAMGMQAAPLWVLSAVDRLLFGRLLIDGAPVDVWGDLSRARVGPALRWQLLGVQISQTFGELWTRAPYDAGAPRGKDYGVPDPKVPRAVAWAAVLSREGYASSTVEILEQWTPLRLGEIVELAAARAENHRRATEDAAQGGRA